MNTGVIKHWVADRGFGFIRPDDGQEEIFVHFRELQPPAESLPRGTRVEFEVRPNPRNGKTEAHSVRVLGVIAASKEM